MKNAIKVISFAAILALCIVVAYKVLILKDASGKPYTCVRQLEYTDDNKIDAVFVGSSHVYAGIRPGTMWNEFGIVSFDLSVSGMDMDSTYYYTKYILETQSPKFVILDLYSITFEEHAVEENKYRNFLGLPYSKNSYDLVNAYFDDPDINLDYQLRWPIIHTRYKELTVTDFKDLGFARYGRGERYVPENTQALNLEGSYTTEIAELDEKRQKWLDDFKALSEEYGFELIFIVIPFTTTEEGQTYLNAGIKYAEENGIDCFDFNKMIDELGIDIYKDFSDCLHLNNDGAEKLSRWLGTYLVYDKGIPTHQGEEGYDYWNLDFSYFNHMKSVEFLKTTYNIGALEEFFRTLGAINGISYVVSLDEGWAETAVPYIEYMKYIDVNYEEALSGGVWVKVSGQDIQHIASDDDTEIHYVDFDEVTSARIARAEKEAQTEIYIGNQRGQAASGGINVAVYDNINNKYIGNWNFK